MMTLPKTEADRCALLEALVDDGTLAGVLESLDSVCRAKAEHLRVNWQDSRSARTWDKAGVAVGRLSGRVHV